MAVQFKIPKARQPVYEGEMRGNAQPNDRFAKPLTNYSHSPEGLGVMHNDIGEMSGFQIDGYFDKNGQPYGEAVKLNYLPPGMDISNQANADIRNMPMKYVTSHSFPGDGWEPAPRDIEEYATRSGRDSAVVPVPQTSNNER